MKRVAMILALGCVVCMSVGCISRGIKEGVGAVSGGKGRAQIVQTPASLAEYTNIEVGTFTNSFGGVTPGGFMGQIPGQVAKEIGNKKLPLTGTGKTLTITGDIIYYETAPASGQIFGPLEEAIANVRLVDKASGKTFGTACCVGRSTSTTSQGTGTKAQGLGKAIAAWISEKYPKTE